MATSENFIKYVCDELDGVGNIRYRKMFGEYLIYINEKPIITVCDETVYVKKLECLEEKMKDAEVGYPYEGAKEHYILDIDNQEFSKMIVSEIEAVTPLPIKKAKKPKIESRCGICCSKCQFLKDKMCIGCTKISKPFWGDSCPVKDSCESKKLECCGECLEFPCDLLKSFAYDKNQGDNGLRIENCKKWCNKK